MQAVILAAGRGSRLGPSGELIPKCLVEVGGRPLIEHQLASLRGVGVSEVVVVVGHCADAIRSRLGEEVAYVENERYAETNSLFSLSLADVVIDGAFMLLNGDTLAHPEVYQRVGGAMGCALAYDSASGSEPEHMKVVFRGDRLDAINKAMDGELAHGENVGILKFDRAGAGALFQRAADLVRRGRINDWAPAAVHELAQEVAVRGIDVCDLPWTEIDFPDDLAHALRSVWPAVERGSVGLEQRSSKVAEVGR